MKKRHRTILTYYLIPIIGLILTCLASYYVFDLEYRKNVEILRLLTEDRLQELQLEEPNKTFEEKLKIEANKKNEPINLIVFDGAGKRLYPEYSPIEIVTDLHTKLHLIKKIKSDGQDRIIATVLNDNLLQGIDVKEVMATFILGFFITLFFNLYIKKRLRVQSISEEMQQYKRAEADYFKTVAHELKTPLTSLRGALGLVYAQGSAQSASKEIQGLIKIAYRNSKRVIRMVNRLLGGNRIKVQELNFKLEPYSLVDLIKDALEDNRIVEEEYGVQFKLENEVEKGMVLIDPDEIREVVDNLLSNAAKYTHKGDIIEVRIQKFDGVIRVSVTDHGPGISDRFKSRIFEKFTRDSTHSQDKKGWGLGLHISKMIIERHSGKIDFSTILNQGTTFYFELKSLE